jgi:hypothetical protein
VCSEGELSIEAKRVWCCRVNALNCDVKVDPKLTTSPIFVEVCVNEKLWLLNLCSILLC